MWNTVSPFMNNVGISFDKNIIVEAYVDDFFHFLNLK